MRKVVLWIGSIMLAAAGVPAAAQYRCAAPNGVIYQSSAPCRAAAPAPDKSRGGEGIRYYGPVETESRYQQRLPSIGEAPPQLKYMSPQCSGLHDALRTASARGLRYETIAKMRKDYQAECAEDESEARGRLSEEMRDKSKQKREAQVAQAQERDRTALQREQCGEFKRILVSKRARTDLTEGEKAELQRSETNYRARCS